MRTELLSFEFEGTKVTTILYDGRPCWRASDIGAGLIYSDNGRRFVDKIVNEWSNEFKRGIDFEDFEDSDLIKLFAYTDSVHAKIRKIRVLYESGLYKALMLTKKPAGVRMREWLATEVLPQIRKTGSYSSKHQASDKRLELAWSREHRLDRQLKSKALEKLVKVLRRDKFPEDTIRLYEICATEAATGENLSSLKPSITEEWLSPSDIANMLSVTPNRIGRIITELNLRGKEGYSRAIMNKSTSSNREVTSFLYNRKAFSLIEQKVKYSPLLLPGH